MTIIDDRTVHLSLALPNAGNALLDDVARLRSAFTDVDTAVNGKQAALGFTPENVTSKNAANGYAGLDSGGKVAAAQLPSYVDDVVEAANFASLPTTGETGKIYVTLDTNKTYRWSGSAYPEISASPGSTDAVAEGATNLYFTAARAIAAIPVSTASVLGSVKVGSGLNVAGDGTVSVVGGGGGSGLPAFGELTIVPTANGQTTFTPAGGYTVGQIEWYKNGVLQYGNGDDYTASNGTTIVMSVGANTVDTFLLRKWEYLPTTVTVGKSSATGAVAMSAGTTAQRDASPGVGWTRWNSTLGANETWNGSVWAREAEAGANADITSLTAITSINGGQIAGNRRKGINGDFSVNQRVVSGTVTLAAGAYGHDGWKAGAGGCTYTFATVNNLTTVTISAGTLLQVLDGTKLHSGTHVLSWGGTAQGRWGAGSYAASGVQGTVVGGTNINIEFGTGTLSLVQAEPGTVATSFEFKDSELALCQRYCRPLSAISTLARADLATSVVLTCGGPPMRAVPTLTPATGITASLTASALTYSATYLGAGGDVSLVFSTTGATAGQAGYATVPAGTFLSADL